MSKGVREAPSKALIGDLAAEAGDKADAAFGMIGCVCVKCMVGCVGVYSVGVEIRVYLPPFSLCVCVSLSLSPSLSLSFSLSHTHTHTHTVNSIASVIGDLWCTIGSQRCCIGL